MNPNFVDLSMRTIFLIGLASGARVSELHSFLKRKGHIVFDMNICDYSSKSRVSGQE